MKKKRRNRIIRTPLYKQRMKSDFSKPPKALTKAMEEKQQKHREIMKAPLQGYPQGGYVRRPRNSSIAANDQQEPVNARYERWAAMQAREIVARRAAEKRFNRICLGISIILIAVGTLIVKFFQ